MSDKPALRTCKQMAILEIDDARKYFKKLSEITEKIEATFCSHAMPLENCVKNLAELLARSCRNRKKIMAVGNGGSAAIASHALVDFVNAGEFESVNLLDSSLMTCVANDYGYQHVFSEPIRLMAHVGDILFAVSSSGNSQNILEACKAAKDQGCFIVTLSGFKPDNLLRKEGYYNFYVPSEHYGFVEVVHQALMHCIFDLFIVEKGRR